MNFKIVLLFCAYFVAVSMADDELTDEDLKELKDLIGE